MITWRGSAIAAIIGVATVYGVVSAARHRIQDAKALLSGQGVRGDWKSDSPGANHFIKLSDLPAPYATKSTDNFSRIVPRPDDAWPKAPEGFKVEAYATKLQNPRRITVAPNGDVFVAESMFGRIRLLRGLDSKGQAVTDSIFTDGLRRPFGIAFYPPGPNPKYVYIGNTDAVVRIPYKNGDLKASGAVEKIVDLPGGGQLRGGGHWTRDIVFTGNGKRMLVSVGSFTNVGERGAAIDERRATVLEFTPEGKDEKVFASGIRNAVGMAIHPQTGDVWASVNERDGLGDDLVPDYITRVKEGGFYGWPWFYLGANQDPRHKDAHPELKSKVIVPDVLLQSHSASLQMCFYTGQQFPKAYTNDAFAAEHGSWNRVTRTGYKVVRVPLKNGVPTGGYQDFLTGFLTADGAVWGRPVGVAVAQDGALLVTDDGSGTVWRVSYTGKSSGR